MFNRSILNATNLSLFYDAVSILLRISSDANRNSLRLSGVLPIVSSILKGSPKTILIQCLRVSKSITFPPILFIDPSRLDSILRGTINLLLLAATYDIPLRGLIFTPLFIEPSGYITTLPPLANI